ncbi:MAG: Ribosomal RNA small subunit methyltransferase B [Alphaproteobacteria bacterium MarineAlpha11_Bin1]|nr:MAG: Ribosomal RNA small subunit methyltransferase B [Alphaproteobacteria bacterium MarineAlpha11_Bin1]|tara:strand:+ start:6947 stop:8257 length:1311 start_codon:yes stop_codon:yes gene_type:complete
MNITQKGNLGLATRAQAHTILREVIDRHRPLDEVLQTDKRFAKLEARDRAFSRNLISTTLRRLGQIDIIIDDCLDRPLPKSAAAARNAMRLGVCQILFLDTHTYAAVDTSVTLAGQRGPDRFRGLVNGILRRVVRMAGSIPLTPEAERANVPDWLWQSWCGSFDVVHAANIAAAHLKIPPIDLTVPKDRPGWLKRLSGEAIGASTVRLAASGDIKALPGFGDGAWWVQDAAAALPAQLIPPPSVAREVLDLCAAPGGKTAQLASTGHNVIALDIASVRLKILAENLRRLKLTATVVEADLLTWKTDQQYDSILLDAPCTATGTIRRHPDIPILKSAADVTRQSDVQRKFLDRACDLLRDGGNLVYSVCSMEKLEGLDQINQLLARNINISIDPVEPSEVPGFESCINPDGFLQTTPAHLSEKGGVDGFFIARLKKN